MCVVTFAVGKLIIPSFERWLDYAVWYGVSLVSRNRKKTPQYWQDYMNDKEIICLTQGCLEMVKKLVSELEPNSSWNENLTSA